MIPKSCRLFGSDHATASIPEHDPEKLQTFFGQHHATVQYRSVISKSCRLFGQDHDPDRHSSAPASNPDPGRLARRRACSRWAADPPNPPTCRPCAALAPAAPAWQHLRPGLCTLPPRRRHITACLREYSNSGMALLLPGRERWCLSVVGEPKSVPVIRLKLGSGELLCQGLISRLKRRARAGKSSHRSRKLG